MPGIPKYSLPEFNQKASPNLFRQIQWVSQNVLRAEKKQIFAN